MKYITLNDLSETVRKNIWKIPRDIDYIIGIPRSGMIAASVISSYLNVPLTDVRAFLAGLEPYGGDRLLHFKSVHRRIGKALVVDDTVFSGRAMNEARRELQGVRGMDFIFMCVYLEGRGKDAVDLYLEDLRAHTDNFTKTVIYEWNIFQHHPNFMEACLYDLDGVLCLDPPDERDEKKYLAYIRNAAPLFIPRTKLGGIITYRLSKNRQITEEWLANNGIRYGELMMFEACSYAERERSGISPEEYKSDIYLKQEKYNLFVESSDRQAKTIAETTKKPVYCVETNKVYQ